MKQLQVTTTQKREVIDITDEVAHSLIGQEGTVTVFVAHTTAAITTADLDPGTDLDFLDFLNSLVPDIHWRHSHNPTHAPDHLLASLISPSVIVPYTQGTLQLGAWQRIILVECDGPRDRMVIIA